MSTDMDWFISMKILYLVVHDALISHIDITILSLMGIVLERSFGCCFFSL